MIRKKTRDELFNKYGTDSYKLYASGEAVKGIMYGNELIKKYPILKYLRILFVFILIFLFIMLIKLIVWLGGLI